RGAVCAGRWHAARRQRAAHAQPACCARRRHIAERWRAPSWRSHQSGAARWRSICFLQLLSAGAKAVTYRQLVARSGEPPLAHPGRTPRRRTPEPPHVWAVSGRLRRRFAFLMAVIVPLLLLGLLSHSVWLQWLGDALVLR